MLFLFCYLLGILSEDSLQTSRIVFALAVVEEDSVLLLLYVGKLGVAIAPNLLAQREQCIYLTLQALIEILLGYGRVAIAPRSLSLLDCLVLFALRLRFFSRVKLDGIIMFSQYTAHHILLMLD